MERRGVATPEDASPHPLDVVGHTTQHGRLPGPRLAGEDEQAGVDLDGSEELGTRALVDGASIEDVRIHRVSERIVPETERQAVQG